MNQKLIVTESQYTLIKKYLEEYGGPKKQRGTAKGLAAKDANKARDAEIMNKKASQVDTSNTTAEPIPAEEPTQQEPVDTQSQSSKNAGAPVDTNSDDAALKQAAGTMNSIEQILKRWGLHPETSKKIEVVFLNDVQDMVYDANRKKFVKAFDNENNPKYLVRRGYRHIGVFDTSTMMGICSAIGGDKQKSLTFNYKGELSGGTNNTLIATKIKYTNQKASIILTREVSREEQLQKIENFKQQYRGQPYIEEFLGQIESTINPNREFSEDDLETYMTTKIQDINLKINQKAQQQNPQAPKTYDKNLAAITFGMSRPLLTIKLQVVSTSKNSTKTGNKAAPARPIKPKN